MSKINIRLEKEKDYDIVENIAREAFWNLYIPGANEHYVVHQLRNSPDLIRDLSYVIELDDKIVGAIFYTHSKIVAEDGSEFNTISFGPVFIRPEYHRKGLGRLLITHSIEIAKQKGYKAIMTLGYPYHYEPYGFKSGKAYNVSMLDGKFYKGLLVLPLSADALYGVSGKAVFSEALECTDEEVEKFNKRFPDKEKLVLPSQKEFELACAMLD